MSEYNQAWEAKLRQQVEQHEFEYDPAAWEAMESLLDGGGAPPASSAASSIWQWLRWLLLGAGAIVLVWVLLLPNTPQKNNLPEERPVLERQSQTEQVEDEGEMSLSAPETIPSEPDRTSKLKRAEHQVEPLTPLPGLSPTKLQPLPPRPTEVVPMLPPSRLQTLQDSSNHFSEEELPDIRLPKRKRNRKTLFPDVIKQQ